MFGWEYPPLHCGGLGVACQGLVRGLLQRGVQITLALPHAGHTEENVTMLYPTETMFHTIQVSSLLTPYDAWESFGTRAQTLPTDIREIYGHDLGQAIEYFTNSAVEMTKNVRPDIIHCHDWMTYEAGIRAARFHRKPLVAHIHATELDRTNFSPNQWIFRREKRGFEMANSIIAVSNYTKNILVSHYGIPSAKITVVHNGNSEEYSRSIGSMCWQSPQKRNPLVLFLGRLTIQKGTHQFLDMASIVHSMRPDVEFVMAGTGQMFGELIDSAIDRGLGDVISFAGKVNSEEARTLYSRADCFVMPSISEPFGLVALEAAAEDTPLVLSKQSGAVEVLNHAFAVDFWDTEKMADSVLTILRDPPLAQQMRTESRNELHRLTWANQSGKVQSIYETTISSRLHAS